jgi:hypothetical protein
MQKKITHKLSPHPLHLHAKHNMQISGATQILKAQAICERIMSCGN